MERNFAARNTKGSIPEPPLDMKMLRVTDKYGQQIFVPALNIGFMDPRQFVQYKPPPPSCFKQSHGCENTTNESSEEAWVNRMLYIQEDLHWLLKLPHHRFWSQVIYDDGLQQCLESYLSHGPRKYDMSGKMKNKWAPLLKNVHRLVFMAFLRMSVCKESKIHYITPTAFGDLIYDYFVFDIPKIMDLCAIYGQDNEALLKKMITNIFHTQPKFMRDLEKAAHCIGKLFSEVECMVNDDITSEAVENCIQTAMENKSSLHFSLATAFSITETCSTLSSFLNIYPPACSVFHKYGTAILIAKFYNAVFPALDYQYEIGQHQNESERILMELKCQITMAREFALKVFRYIVVSCCIQPIMEDRDNGILDVPRPWQECIDELAHIFKMVSSETCFVCDYNQWFPIETDLSVLSSVCSKKSLKQLKKISYVIKQQLENFKDTDYINSSSSLSRSNPQVLLKHQCENMTHDVTIPNTLLPGHLQTLLHSGERECLHCDDDVWCDDTCDIPLVKVSEVETEVELMWNN